MALSRHWYIAPMLTARLERAGNSPHAALYCGMKKFIPSHYPENDVDPAKRGVNDRGEKWDEVEILGNHTLVLVQAQEDTHTAIRADNRFAVLPTDWNPSNRDALLPKLRALGYADDESVAPNISQLLRRLAIARSEIRKNASQDDFEVVGTKRLPPSKTVDDVERRVP